MTLLDGIIQSVTETKEPIADILRRCLVLAHKLKNDAFKAWVERELNGYPADAELPDYRKATGTAIGHFAGPLGARISNQPLPSMVMKEQFQHLARDIELRQQIAAYQDADLTGTYRQPWPQDVVVIHQSSFFHGYTLVSAWMPIPGSLMAGMVDNVRTRVLTFALEIQSELPDDTEQAVKELPSEKVQHLVQYIIYGGNNNFGDNGTINANTVIAGDMDSLKNALAGLGLTADDADELKAAVEADEKEEGKHKGLGKRALKWVGKAAVATGKAGVKIGSDVATATLTAIAMKYAGIPPAS